MILTEAALQRTQESRNTPSRLGFEWGIPSGGVTDENVRATGNPRFQLMESLHDAYMACTWVSIACDTIARTCTAGGLILVPDDDVPEGETPVEPSNVKALRLLLRFTNKREDIVQLLRATITDLLVFGDAYIEIVELAGVPCALYSLDAATMSILADEHGEVTGYKQYLDQSRAVKFEPDQIIHIGLDSPRGGLYGASPTSKAMLAITSYLFTAACLKELMRKGDPPRIHADLPKGTPQQEQQKWYEAYMSRNLGTKNIGTPIVTTGGGLVHELAQSKVADYIATLERLMSEILAEYGVPKHKANADTTGALGGNQAEADDKTFRINTVIPICALILEKLNYALVEVGFGITGWHAEFEEIDYRDSTIVEDIRTKRFNVGAYTLNRYRADIGEPPVDGGDDPIVMTRSGPVFVKDLAAYTQASMNSMNAAMVATGNQISLSTGLPGSDGTHAAPVGVVPGDVAQVPTIQGQPPKETRGPDAEARALHESLRKAFQHRRKAVLKQLPKET